MGGPIVMEWKGRESIGCPDVKHYGNESTGCCADWGTFDLEFSRSNCISGMGGSIVMERKGQESLGCPDVKCNHYVTPRQRILLPTGWLKMLAFPSTRLVCDQFILWEIAHILIYTLLPDGVIIFIDFLWRSYIFWSNLTISSATWKQSTSRNFLMFSFLWRCHLFISTCPPETRNWQVSKPQYSSACIMKFIITAIYIWNKNVRFIQYSLVPISILQNINMDIPKLAHEGEVGGCESKVSVLPEWLHCDTMMVTICN